MPKRSFAISDFSGGTNGFLDQLIIADNEVAQCQGFKAESGVVSVLGDMKGAYTLGGSDTAAGEYITMVSGYGLFAFSDDYDRDGALSATNYFALENDKAINIYDDGEPGWVDSAISFGAGTQINPCFVYIDGALRVSPGIFAAADTNRNLDSGESVTASARNVIGYLTALNLDGGPTVAPGEIIVINGAEYFVVTTATDTGASAYIIIALRNTMGIYPSLAANGADVYYMPDAKWRGVVNRRFFEAVTTAGTISEWVTAPMCPRPPTSYPGDGFGHDDVAFSVIPFMADIDTGNLESAGTGYASGMVVVGTEVTTNSDGMWDTTIRYWLTALYDDARQESQPFLLGSAAGTSDTLATGKELGIVVNVQYSDDGNPAYCLNKRAVGARLYYEDTVDELGTLYQLLEIDFEKGCKKAEAEAYLPWVERTADQEAICPTTAAATATSRTGANAFVWTEAPKTFTYELNTGYSATTNIHARFKTATVCERRLFVGNVYQGGKAYGDRMIGSPVNRFDILPETEPYVRVISTGEGDEIVKLESYGDRVLQFKKRTLYIVNVGGGVGEEFLESSHINMGVENPSQTCITEYGVAWVNAGGVFLYDGQGITDLTLNKLQQTNTTDRPRALNVTESNKPIIGYHPGKKWLVVHPQSAITDANDVEVWIHDFKNGSWTYSKEFTSTNDYKTNMVTTSDNELVFAAGTSSSNIADFFKYQDSTSCNDSAFGAATKLLFLTKEFNLGAPGVKKKLRSVYITYSASANSYIEADLIYKHPTGSTTDDLEEAGSGSTYYTEALGFKSTSGAVRTVELVPTTYSTNAYTFQLKLHNPDAAYPEGADFKLYNVQFVYRPLGTR